VGAPPPVPATLADTRLALHRLAVYVVSPARRAATGNEIALEPSPGGFGTPAADTWGRVRVDGTTLVVRRGLQEHATPITTLRAAAVFADVEPDLAAAQQFDVPAAGDLDAPLAIDPEAAALLAGFWSACADALETLRGELTGPDDASPVRLWPEHFDVAIDAGDESAGERGTYGGSPGDDAHPEPYVYASLWSGAPSNPFFAETAFSGASLPYAELASADDPAARALALWREARALL
jgi:hypothetical protein